MPFGVVFAGIVFGVLVPVVGVGLLGAPLPPVRVAGGLLVAFGIALALALFRRLRWARWTGALAGVLLGMLGAFLVSVRGSVLDIVVFLSAFAAAILLIVPRTGDASQAGNADPARRARPAWVLAGTCAAAFLGLAITGGWAFTGIRTADPKPAPAEAATSPAASAPPSAESPASGARATPRAGQWVDYGSGRSRAKSEGRPMLVDFYASWCGPCKMMEHRTFRDPSVVRGLDRLVTARVDSEEEESRNGYRGVELAERFGIEVYPTLVLFDSEGREVSRHTGYAEPRALLSWLDRALAAVPRVVAKNP